MTKLIAIAVALGASPMAAQQRAPANIPPSVHQALIAKFPGIKEVSWSTSPERNFTAEFHRGGVNTRVTLSAATGWLETATEIGAIVLPDVVRRAIVPAYMGYQFMTTWKIVSATAPPEQFEVHLAKAHELVVVRYDPAGKVLSRRAKIDAKPAVYSVADVWRGESVCLVVAPGCTTDTVIFRVTRVASDSSAFDIMMSKVAAYDESITNSLACTLDRGRDTLVCVARPGVWEFKASKDSLTGTLTLDGDIAGRRVALRRVP